MKKILSYLSPISYMGIRDYSVRFPLIVMLVLSALSEVFAYRIVHNPLVVGVYGIYLFLAFIIYFSLRNGLNGGYTAATVTILYYVYIILTRKANGNMDRAEISTTLVLAIIYFILASIIGWLKQRVDTLIEREANEKQRLQAILDQLPVGVLITDAYGDITSANKRMEHLFGKKIYKNPLVKRDDWPLKVTLQTGEDIFGKEFTLLRKNNQKQYVKVSASSIRNKEGKVIAAASIVNDITGEKELEERKNAFISMASHELKTPVTSLLLYVEILIRKLKKMHATDAMQTGIKMQKQLDKLTALVSDLLDVSRIEAGKLTLNKTTFAIEELVTEVIDNIGATLQGHTIIFDHKNTVLVYADRERISQIVINLLTNAAKYSPNSEKIIVNVEEEKENVVVSVQDFGIGIAPEMQEKIFERFFRVEDSEGKTFPGLGMGLHIASEIAIRHNGKIIVESQKGRGSIFSLLLPIEKSV